MRFDTLYRALSDYAVSLRMLDGLNREAERRVHDELPKLRDAVAASGTVDQETAAFLVDFLISTWPQLFSYEDEEGKEIEESFMDVGTAILDALAPDDY